jgi:hypothetical protein
MEQTQLSDITEEFPNLLPTLFQLLPATYRQCALIRLYFLPPVIVANTKFLFSRWQVSVLLRIGQQCTVQTERR